MSRRTRELLSNQRLEGRESQMASVADLLKRVTPDHGVDWGGLVGSTLAALTVPLGVNDAGILRVMAANETALRELQARTDSVLAVWNLAAEQKEARLAEGLQCWIKEGLVTRHVAVSPPKRTVVAKRAISERYRSDAEAMTGAVKDESVRNALVEMRAKSLAADARTREGE